MNTSELKASELMIGDWVQHQGNGQYMQVSRIDAKHFACGFPYCYEYNNPYTPVPLTAEILSKIGFVNKETWDDTECFGYYYSQHDDDHDFYCKARFVNARGMNFCEFRYYTYGYNSCNVICHSFMFLHELQHALQLCGIEKEITL